MSKITEKDFREWVDNASKKITKDDFEKVIQKQKELEEKFKNEGTLKKFASELQLMLSLIKDYSKGRYKKIPWWSMSAIVLALLYAILPLDLIPDFIPGVGYIDDAAIIGLCLLLVKSDFDEYKEWKNNNS